MVGRCCTMFTAVAFTMRTDLLSLHSHISLTPWSVFQDGSFGCASSDILHTWYKSFWRREKSSTHKTMSLHEAQVHSLIIHETLRWLQCCASCCGHGLCSVRVTAKCFPLNDFRSFNSPFEVLFNFPSGYLFAIDLPSIFNFGWRLPP